MVKSASAALSAFEALKSSFDFIAEGRSGFRKTFEEFEAEGGDLEDAMCFVWYMKSK